MAYHAIIGVAIGLIAPFTAFAWPFAIGVGMIIGHAGVERMHGVGQRGAVHMLRALGVVVGTIAMLVLGAFLGGLIALLIVGLAAFSERVAGRTSPTDQGMARILLVIVAAVTWLVILYVVKPNINISIGG